MNFRSLLLALPALAALPLSSPAADFSFNPGTGNLQWTNTAAWTIATGTSATGYPGASDNIIDIASGAPNLNISGNQAVNNFTLNTTDSAVFTIVAGANNALSSLTIGGTLEFTGGSKTVRIRGSTSGRTLSLNTNNVNINAGAGSTPTTISFGYNNGNSVATNVLDSFTSTGTFTVTGVSEAAPTFVNFFLAAGTTNFNANTFVVNANATVRLNEGGFGTVAAIKNLQGNGGIIETSSAFAVNSTLALNPDNGQSNSYAGTLRNGGGTLAVVKNGAGTQEFTGASTYTGGTTINAGTLLVNNSAGSALGSGPVNVTGGTLGGGGTIGATVTLQSGAHLAPGNSVGTITVSNLNLLAGSVLDYEFNGSGNDLTAVTGALSLTGTTWINLFAEGTDDPFATEGSYVLLSYGSIDGFTASSFSVQNAVAGYQYAFSASGGQVRLDITAVPEPATWGLLGLGAGVLLWRGRRRVS